MSFTAQIDPYTRSSVPITAFYNQFEIAPATGFYWRRNERIFLVSNWHVLSGRNPKTGQAIHDGRIVPNRIEAACHLWISLTGIGGFWHLAKVTIDLSNPNQEDDESLWRWRQHAQFGQDVDVAAVDVTESLSRAPGIEICCINDLRQVPEIIPEVGSDVFILGFPLRSTYAGHLPIWKRGSIATEYGIPYRDTDSFLVDSTTKDGMSGSPVIFRSNAFRTPSELRLSGPTETKFLGIYSGRELRPRSFPADTSVLRRETDYLDTQLGRVWKAKYVTDIVSSGVPGREVLRPE